MTREPWQLTQGELNEIERAMNRDLWVQEFNSLPTAIERIYRLKMGWLIVPEEPELFVESVLEDTTARPKPIGKARLVLIALVFVWLAAIVLGLMLFMPTIASAK